MPSYSVTLGVDTELKNNFVRITAKSESEARRAMWASHGAAWAVCDDSQEAAGVATYPLTEVPLGTPTTRRDRDAHREKGRTPT